MEYIGCLMIAMPFIVLFGAMWVKSGLGVALQVSGIVLGIVAWLAVAIYLTDPNAVLAFGGE